MAGENIYIWQCQDGVGAARSIVEAADADDVMACNSTGKVVSEGVYIDDIQPSIRRAVPENEAVDEDNNELQDMGIGGLDITIHGYIGNADNDATTNGVNKIIKWIKDGNESTDFPKGRYGLELDNAPQWDVTPTSTYGYYIRNCDFHYIGEKKDLAEFTLYLSLSGAIENAI